MPDPNNDDRANWAEAALRAFQAVTKTDDEDAVSDLIGDLLHLAARQGLDPQLMLDRAQANYEAECEEEATPGTAP